MTTPYIYSLTLLATNQVYIGSRTRKGCSPTEFWTSYFTSSKEVHRLIDEHGTGADVWSYVILHEFDSSTCGKQVVKVEHELIKHAHDELGAQAILNNSYNQYGKTVFTVTGRKRPQSECDAISRAQRGRKRTPQQIQKHRVKMTGRTLSDEHRQKVSEALKGRVVTQTTRDAISKSQQKWNNSGATPISTSRWLNAQAIYTKWLETSYGYSRLGKIFNEPRPTALQDMVALFKSGWIPHEDDSWLAFKITHDASILP